jgi:histidyl-tRNA synthetase
VAPRYQNVKGTRDLLWPETHLWSQVEAKAREVFGSYGYGEIRTPILEETELFVRSVGETTDIVGKEMYTFTDRKGRSLTLRPESTASIARSFIQHGMEQFGLPARLFSMGSHFRYERPQKGRYREFHQIDAELIGEAGPAADAEVLLMLVRFLTELGFTDLTVLLNTVGDTDSRAAYREALRAFLGPRRARLGEDSRRRLETNPLRILDSKDPEERELLSDAPRIEDSLSEASRAHFAGVRQILERCGVQYRVEPRLVRGLDYYTLTVFEVSASGLGAQDAIVGGGRYDTLLEQLGGPAYPAIGFAIGEDRLIEVLRNAAEQVDPGYAQVQVIGIGGAPAETLSLAEDLRERTRAMGRERLRVSTELGDRSLKAALRRAGEQGRRFAVLLGPSELAAGTVTVKDLRSGEQRTVARADVAAVLVASGANG